MVERDRLEVGPSPTRRAIMLIAIGGVGAMLVWLGFAASGGLAGRLVLLVFGVCALSVLPALWRATSLRLVLDQGELTDTAGNRICTVDQVEGVERGALAFKPSNGFSLVLKERQSRGWVPGLWWRVGRRVGVGGILPSGQTKFMAEMIEMQRREP